MVQAFQLLSGPLVRGLLTHPENRLARLLESGAPAAAMVGDLYWTALGREPSPAELGASLAVVEAAGEARAGLEDVLWGLVNAKEFLFRH
jgi:hypothetical protein